MKILLSLAAVLFAAACGSSGHAARTVPSLGGGGSAAKATATASGSRESQFLAFSKCMREHGMPNWPDPTTDANGNVRLQFPKGVDPNSAAMTTARTACSSYLKGITQGFTQADRSAMQDALLGFTRCMRAHGVAMKDPDFSQNNGLGTLGTLDRNDPRVAAALKSCNTYLQKLSALAGVGGSS